MYSVIGSLSVQSMGALCACTQVCIYIVTGKIFHTQVTLFLRSLEPEKRRQFYLNISVLQVIKTTTTFFSRRKK